MLIVCSFLYHVILFQSPSVFFHLVIIRMVSMWTHNSYPHGKPPDSRLRMTDQFISVATAKHTQRLISQFFLLERGQSSSQLVVMMERFIYGKGQVVI